MDTLPDMGDTTRRGAVAAGLMASMALAAIDQTIVATAVPSIVRDLGSFSLFPWVIAAYLLTQAVSTPVYGRLADLFGRKPMLLTGMSIFLVGSLLGGVACLIIVVWLREIVERRPRRLDLLGIALVSVSMLVGAQEEVGYERRGVVTAAVHNVFLAMLAIAALGLLAILIVPRRRPA